MADFRSSNVLLLSINSVLDNIPEMENLWALSPVTLVALHSTRVCLLLFAKRVVQLLEGTNGPTRKCAIFLKVQVVEIVAAFP
jgi:hypothetical protein